MIQSICTAGSLPAGNGAEACPAATQFCAALETGDTLIASWSLAAVS